MSGPLNENLVLGLVAIVAVSSTLLSMMALVWVTRRGRGKRLPVHTPPVTIFKPLKGLDEELEENLRAFSGSITRSISCSSALPRRRSGHCRRPEADGRVSRSRRPTGRGCPAFGLNPKVENLASMDRFRKHDVILISDSNVRVRPSYLRETACYLAEPGVGLVTNLFAGVGESALRRDHGEPAAQWLHRRRHGAGLGSAGDLRGRQVDADAGQGPRGGRRVCPVRNLLAEDQVIGVLVRKAGYSIRLRHHVIDNVNRRRGFRLVPQPAFAMVQDPPPDGLAHIPGRSRWPTWRRWAWSGRFRASRASPGAGWRPGRPGHGPRRASDPLAARPVPRAPKTALRPIKDVLLLPSGSTRW